MLSDKYGQNGERMEKQWQDVKNNAPIERIQFELDSLKEKVEMLTTLIPEGEQNWCVPHLIRDAMLADIQMLESELCTIQAK